jgi:hypothetical protein
MQRRKTAAKTSVTTLLRQTKEKCPNIGHFSDVLAPQVRLELTTLRLTVLEIQNPEKSRNAEKIQKVPILGTFLALHDGTAWTNRTVENKQKNPKYSKEYSKFSNRKRPPYLVFPDYEK